MNIIMTALEWINAALLAPSAAVLLFAGGLYMTLALKFFYYKRPLEKLKLAMSPETKDGTSPLSALCVALAGTIGVGNISGVAVAIMLGGAGAVFWLWTGALLGMAVKYAEVVLAVLHRQGNSPENYHGGAFYYIRALGGKFGRISAAAFCVLMLIDAFSTGAAIQINAISESLYSSLGLPHYITGIVFALLCGIVLMRGISGVVKVTNMLVPIMSVIYIAAALAVIAVNAGELPSVFARIFGGAFSPSAAGGGIVGILMSPALRFGIVKGLFSNEAGCGTAPSAHACANTKSPAKEGLLGVFEVFADTILICTLTSLALLCASPNGSFEGGMELCIAAFECVFGGAAGGIISLCIILFAFATIICWGYYGIGCVRYFTAGKAAKNIFLVMFCASVFAGAIAAPLFLWSIADCVVSIMMIFNTLCVLLMFGSVKEQTRIFQSESGNTSSRKASASLPSESFTKNEMHISDTVR